MHMFLECWENLVCGLCGMYDGDNGTNDMAERYSLYERDTEHVQSISDLNYFDGWIETNIFGNSWINSEYNNYTISTDICLPEYGSPGCESESMTTLCDLAWDTVCADACSDVAESDVQLIYNDWIEGCKWDACLACDGEVEDAETAYSEGCADLPIESCLAFCNNSLPTSKPTSAPTVHPSGYPSMEPTKYPSQTPSANPTKVPSHLPTGYPTHLPSFVFIFLFVYCLF